MKKLFLALALLMSHRAFANALASIYNGDQFNLNGRVLVQDADHPTDFYILPQTYQIMDRKYYDVNTGELKDSPGIKHKVQTIGGVAYSVYTLRLELDAPGDMELMMARNQLQRIAGPQARIKGLAPICGINLSMPLTERLNSKEGARPDAVFVKYSVKSTEPGKCDSILTTSEFNLEIWAPMTMEPGVAAGLTSDVGLTLPPLELVLPYKYKDSVKVSVNAKKTYELVKAGLGLAASFKVVSAGITANMSHVFETLTVSGGLHVDCQNPDRSICDKFLDQAKEILSQTLVRYISVPAKGEDATPIVGNQDGAVPKMVRAEMAMSETSLTTEENFTVDFSNVSYSSIRTQAQLDLSGVSPNVLDPQVRKLLESN